MVLGDIHESFLTQKTKEVGYFHQSMADSPKKKEAQNEFLKKIRISQLEGVYDLITLGQNFLQDIDRFLDCMNQISGMLLFHEYSQSKVRSDGLNAIPAWFYSNRSHHISEWILQKFEISIIYYFLNQGSRDLFQNTLTEKRDAYIDIWMKIQPSK